jgi:hypothetical protein
MLKRVLLILFGAIAGIALGIAAPKALNLVRPAAAPLTASERRQLEHLLDDNPNEIFMFDEATSYRYKPSFRGNRTRANHLQNRPAVTYPHVTNSLGLIGPEEVNADPRRTRLLLLGDSVTYGAWVDFHDTFPARLQAMGAGVCQIAIGACEGWSTKQELAFHDKYLRHLPWNVIVLVFCLNDLVDFEWVYKSSAGFQLSQEMAEAGTGLSKTNQSIAGLKLAARRLRFAEDARTEPLAKQTNTTLWAWDADKWQAYLDNTLAPFVHRRERPPVAIVIAPTKWQLESLQLGADPQIVLYPQFRLESFCRDERLTCIDLVEAFPRHAATPLDTLFLDDLHFSEEGHAVVARYLWPRLIAVLREAAPTAVPPTPAKEHS